MIKGLASTGFGRYTQTMHLLVAGILQKIQFRLDSDLTILDNESLDDDVSISKELFRKQKQAMIVCGLLAVKTHSNLQMQTEWQQYLTQCIETVALVADVLPLQVFEQVYAEWLKPFEIFESLEKSIDSNGMLIINDNQRSHLVYCILRDLSSLCQTLTRIAPILQGMAVILIAFCSLSDSKLTLSFIFVSLFRWLARDTKKSISNHIQHYLCN